MSMALGITLGIREELALSGLFMLTWCCMAFGFLVEYISTPKAYTDTVNHKYPIGPLQMKKFADPNNNEYGKTDYYEDPHALKLISQTEWEVRLCLSPHGDAHAPHTKPHPCLSRSATGRSTTWPTKPSRWPCSACATLCARSAPATTFGTLALKTNSRLLPQSQNLPLRRMVPHIFGWFPMTSVWFWLFTQLENAKRDLSEVSDREIPVWVNAVIIGTFFIFMSFAFVRASKA